MVPPPISVRPSSPTPVMSSTGGAGHSRRPSLAPASFASSYPTQQQQHSRQNSSVSITLSPRPPISPGGSYSVYSAASERDAFLLGSSASPSPYDTHHRSSSPLPSPTFGEFFHHLPQTHKRSRTRCLLLFALPALILILVFASWQQGVNQAVLREQLGQWKGTVVEHGISKLSEWGDRVQGSWKEAVAKEGAGATTTIATATDDGTLEIEVLPRPRLPEEDNSETKYLGYLAHSGYHNQREALQNALMLAHLLNRTLLIDPVWIGWPGPTEYYSDLQQTWNNMIKITPASFQLEDDPDLFLPVNFSSSMTEFPLPGNGFNATARLEQVQALSDRKKQRWEALGYKIRPDGYPITNLTAADCKSYSPECRHTYKDTFLSWDSLVDLDKASQLVPLVDRWDMRERALEKLLDLEPDDFFVFQDEQRYDFQFKDAVLEPDAPLPPLITMRNDTSRWHRTVSLPTLRTFPYKVILIGTLFGYERVKGHDFAEQQRLEAFFDQSMAFRSPWILEPADAIRDRLGGSEGFVGVHARVGDGTFASHAERNMEDTWRKLVAQLGVEEEVVEDAWSRFGYPYKAAVLKRELPVTDTLSPWSIVDVAADEATFSRPRNRRHERSRLQPRAPITPSLHSLTCRSPLHSDPALAHFNTPLYLATDSRDPVADPHLAPFFASFPCTFILSDFDRPNELNGGEVVEGIETMTKLVNKHDKVPLGRLFLPFLEATVAAKGFTTSGTPGSTFSQFAEGGLHDAFVADAQAAGKGERVRRHGRRH